MGSFNMKCALSNLPITNGDEVIMIPMIYRFLKNTSEIILPEIIFENNNILQPYPMAVIGTYNDYGNIENIQNEKIVEILTKYMFSNDENNNISDLNKTYFVSNDIIPNISLEELEHSNCRCTTVYWTFVLKKILLKFMDLKFDFFSLKEKKSYNDLINDGIIQHLINGLMDIDKNVNLNPTLYDFIQLGLFSKKFGLWELLNIKIQQQDLIFKNNLNLNNFLFNLASENKITELQDFAYHLILIDCLQTSMLYLNNIWLPKSGVGQGWENGIIDVIKFKNEICLDYINKKS